MKITDLLDSGYWYQKYNFLYFTEFSNTVRWGDPSLANNTLAKQQEGKWFPRSDRRGEYQVPMDGSTDYLLPIGMEWEPSVYIGSANSLGELSKSEAIKATWIILCWEKLGRIPTYWELHTEFGMSLAGYSEEYARKTLVDFANCPTDLGQLFTRTKPKQ